MGYSFSWPTAYLLTLLVEGICVLAVLAALRERLPLKSQLIGVLCANFTHPVLWLWLHTAGNTLFNALTGEIAVTLAETLIWRCFVRKAKLPWLLATGLAVIANSCSLAVGLIFSISGSEW